MPTLPKRRMLPAPALIFSPQTQPASRAKIWCTGKDSNLRTSQGGADLQSAGFNHSPTCALAVSVEQRALSNHFRSLIAHSSKLFQTRRNRRCDYTLPLGDQKV